MDRLAPVLLAALALTACRQPVPPPQPPSIDTFEASPSAVPIAGATIQLRWSTTGAVQARFGNEIVPTSGEKSVFATPGQLFTLSANGNNQTVTSDLVIGHVAGVPVNGTVVNEQGQPLAGAEVQIGPLSATTDSAGRFTISDAPRPYTAAVSAANHYSAHFVGLSDDAPTLWTETYLNPPSNPRGATLRLRVDAPDAGGVETYVWSSVTGRDFFTTELGSSNALMRDVALSWRGDGGADFDVLAYQAQIRHPDPPLYLAAADLRSLRVEDPDAGTLNVTLMPYPLAMGRATVTLPSWASYAITSEELRLPGRQPVEFGSLWRTFGTIDAELPAWDAGTIHFRLLATRDSSTACTPYASIHVISPPVELNGPRMSIDLGDVPQPQPCNDATVNRSASVGWGDGGVLCELQVSPSNGGVELYFTTAGSVPVLDLPDGQFSTRFSWEVSCYPGFTTTAEALTEAFREVRERRAPGLRARLEQLHFNVPFPRSAPRSGAHRPAVGLHRGRYTR